MGYPSLLPIPFFHTAIIKCLFRKFCYFQSAIQLLFKYHLQTGHSRLKSEKCAIQGTHAVFIFPQCTMNIFGSKSGHLSNRIIGRFFIIFYKIFAVQRVPNVLQNSKKSSNIAKNLGKLGKPCNSYYFLNGHFGTKTVHSTVF